MESPLFIVGFRDPQKLWKFVVFAGFLPFWDACLSASGVCRIKISFWLFLRILGNRHE
jgi:hypothetical protein